VAWLPRPNVRLRNITDLGHVFSLVADTKPINGGYLSQPLGVGIVEQGKASRVVVRNANFNRNTTEDIAQIFDRQMSTQKDPTLQGGGVQRDHREDRFNPETTDTGVNEEAESV